MRQVTAGGGRDARNSGPFVPRGARGRVQVAARGGAEARAAGSRPGQRRSACAALGARRSGPGSRRARLIVPRVPGRAAQVGGGGRAGVCGARTRVGRSPPPRGPPLGTSGPQTRACERRAPRNLSALLLPSEWVTCSPGRGSSLAPSLGAGSFGTPPLGTTKPSHLGNLREPSSHAWVPAAER